MKKIKKLLFLTMTMVALVVCFALSASALWSSGYCGSNVYWNYDSYSEDVVISGSGRMYDYYNYDEESPFYGSYYIDKVVIEDGVKSIGSGAFEACYYINDVTIADGVTSIGCEAFSDCGSLSYIVIPESVKYIEDSAFDGCVNLRDVYYTGSHAQWNDIEFFEDNEDLVDANIHFNYRPGKTTSLKAATTQNTVKLSWKKVPGATGYRVYQYDYSKGSSDKLATITGTSYTVKYLNPGKKCRFSVKAYKKINGIYYWSDAYTIVVTSTLPGKTSSLKATPAQKSVKLTWNAVSGATGYRVYQYDYSEGYSNTLDTVSSRSYTVKNLKPGTKYRFSVKAYKKVEGKTYWSDDYTIVVTSTLPGKTSSLKATTTQKSVKLTWNAVAGATGYRVYQYDFKKEASDILDTISGRSYTIKNLKPGTKYRFSVKAYRNQDGKTYWSDDYTIVVTATLPGKTSSLKATPAQKSIKLTWNAVSGATGYRVYQYDYNKDASDILDTIEGRSYTVKNLKPGTKYRFSVKAYKEVGGKMYWSDVYTIVVTSTLPGKTSTLKATPTKTTVKLSWKAVPGASGYRVYQYDYNEEASDRLATIDGTSYTVKGLKKNKKYRFSVKAYKEIDGKLYWSDVYTIVETKTKK